MIFVNGGSDFPSTIEVNVVPHRAYKFGVPWRGEGMSPIQTHYTEVSPEEQELMSVFSVIGQYLKGVDGIDETAAGAVQVRGEIGAAVALGVFVVGFPFVVLGMIGMVGESREARESLVELSEESEAMLSDLSALVKRHSATEDGFITIDMANLSDRDLLGRIAKIGNNIYQNECQKKSITPSECLVDGAQVMTELVSKSLVNRVGNAIAYLQGLATEVDLQQSKEILQYCNPDYKKLVETYAQLNEKNERRAEVLFDRVAAPFGEFALKGMTAAMVPGVGWGAAEIATRSMRQETPQTVSEISGSSAAATSAASFGAIVGGIFAPANLSMAVYGGIRAKAGKEREARLKKNIERLSDLHEQQLVSEDVVQIHTNYTDAEIESNRWSSIRYGVGTTISQLNISAAGVASLAAFFGAASIGTAGTVMAAGGAGGAIAAAGVRIRNDVKRDIRHGDEGGLSELCLQQYKYDAVSESAKNPKDVLSNYSAHLKVANNNLAQCKLLSLAVHAIEEVTNPEERLSLLQQWVEESNGKRGRVWGKGTSLTESAIEVMREKLMDYKYAILRPDNVQAMEALIRVAKGAGDQDISNDIVNSLHHCGMLQEFGDKFVLELMRSTDMPNQEVEKKQIMRVEEKLLSHIFKAYETGDSAKQRESSFVRLLNGTLRGKTRRSPAAIDMLKVHPLSQLDGSENDLVHQLMCSSSKEQLRERLLKETQCDPTLINRLAEYHGTDIAQQSAVGPFGVLYHSMQEHTYKLNLTALVSELESVDASPELKGLFYKISIPLCIEGEKNAAKVAMRYAVEGMDTATHYFKSESELRKWQDRVENIGPQITGIL